ncbi:hypothetical protein [Nocardioides sp. Iso805N]|uniref:hypothetical protein n=1 Tax=Nocardioides sp. Iso805N TaxID=1283287 RepID=UPI0003605CF1|nr:hypothetical protein [Nocardioides sp. Iso805N]
MARRTAHALIAIGAMLATSLVAFGATSAQATTSVQTPKVGECHAMSLKRVGDYADPRKPVPCSKPHTSITFGVAQVQTPLAGLSQPLLTSMGTDACTKLEIQTLGRSVIRRATTVYDFLFFQPTVAQMQAGAEWFRCDLVIFAPTRLLPMPKHLSHPAIPKHRSDSTERCLTSAYYGTPCSTKHAYRPIHVVQFKPVAYPTRSERREAGAVLCPDRTRHVGWSPEATWRAGDRFLVCFAKSSK